MTVKHNSIIVSNVISELDIKYVSVGVIIGLPAVCWFMKAEKWLNLPYPRGIPLIGNVLQIDASRSHWQQVEWREQLGPVFCLRLFFEKMLVVNDYESIREVLVTKGQDYSNGPSNFLRFQLYSYNGKDIGFANSDEPFWYPMKK